MLVGNIYTAEIRCGRGILRSEKGLIAFQRLNMRFEISYSHYWFGRRDFVIEMVNKCEVNDMVCDERHV